jgi:predicted nuclease of predicted toxin-antitoxin system
VRLLIDAQLPPRLARRLRDLGHDAVHVGEIGLAAATDKVVWDAAIERRAILVTKDQDFAVVRAISADGPAIVWVRLGTTTNDVLIARVVGSLNAIEAAIKRGEVIVELKGVGA